MTEYSKINYISPEELTPYQKNSKMHPRDQIVKLARLMQNYGFPDGKAVIVDENKVILHGHGRTLAAIEAGLEKIPYQVVTDISEADKIAWRIADNAVAESDWDYPMLKEDLMQLDEEGFDLSLLALNDTHLEHIDYDFEYGGETSTLDKEKLDDVPDEDKTIERVKVGDLWQLGRHFLLCADCTNKMAFPALLGKNRFDLVFTDPPYGVAIGTKNSFLTAHEKGSKSKRIEEDIEGDTLSPEELKPTLITAFKNVKVYSAEHCTYYVTAPYNPTIFEIMQASIGVRHVLIWDKLTPTFSMNRLDYDYRHEPIYYSWNKRHTFYGEGEFKATVWQYQKQRECKLHPTMKPVALVVNALLNSSQKGMIVGDTFLGSGTTLVACEDTGRICYGMEVSPHYCDVILQRFEDLTGLEPKLVRNVADSL